MSFRCIIEFSLHLDNFKNIDLFHQGIYKLHISISKNSEPAYPYSFTSQYQPTQEDPHMISPSTLEETFIVSKSFLVRYFDETVQINEIYHLRSEIEFDKSLRNTYFSLKFDLFFSDNQGKISLNDLKSPQDLTYEQVSSSEFLLKFPMTFQSTFVPIVFDNSHCCQVSAIINYLLIDYKFRPLFALRTADMAESLSSTIFKLGHKTGREYIGSSLTDSTYSRLMSPLSKTYTQLREFYLTVMQKCLTEAQKHMLQLYYVPPMLSLPGCPVQPLNQTLKLTDQFAGNFYSSEDESVNEGQSNHKFSQRVASHDAKKIATVMMAEFSMVAGQIFQLWHKFQEVVPNCSESLLMMLKDKYYISKRQLLSHGLIRKVVKSQDLGVTADPKKSELNKILAAEKRKKNEEIKIKQKKIIDKNFELTSSSQPVLIEEFCMLDRNLSDGEIFISNFFNKDNRRRENSNHLIVLVHGFQGSSSDMRLIKNTLSVNFPNNLYLCSSYNENDTESSIFVLGKRLAEEIQAFLKENCILSLGRISFIGHSLGGLVIRAALPYLEDFSSRMHSFLTFSSPHLGIIEGSSKLIRAGLWVLNNFKKCESLKQLSFCDNLKIEDCAMVKLSQEKGCAWFSNMVVFSSPQDLYCPHHSARIEITKDLQKFKENGRVIEKMARSLVEDRDKIHRIDVDFYLEGANFDNFIGRAGHIEFLENHLFMKTLVYLHPEFFE